MEGFSLLKNHSFGKRQLTSSTAGSGKKNIPGLPLFVAELFLPRVPEKRIHSYCYARPVRWPGPLNRRCKTHEAGAR